MWLAAVERAKWSLPSSQTSDCRTVEETFPGSHTALVIPMATFSFVLVDKIHLSHFIPMHLWLFFNCSKKKTTHKN